MLPLPQNDLLEVLVALTSSDDAQIVAAATETLKAESSEDLLVAASGQDTAPAVLRTLCFVTSSGHAYHDTSARPRQTLDALLEYLGTLEERYILTPATLAATHAHYRAKLQQGAAHEARAS